MSCQELFRQFKVKIKLCLTWTFISRWRFIPYALCTRFLPDSWFYVNPFGVHSRDELHPPSQDCRDECDIPIFLEEDMKDVSYRAIPFAMFLVASFCCYSSNDFIRICSPVLLKIYLFIILPVLAIFLYASVLILVSASSLWSLWLDYLGLAVIVTLSLVADVTILYQICIKKYELTTALRTVLGTEHEEEFSIMDVSKKISSQLKLFSKYTTLFTKNFDGKFENELFQQFSGQGQDQMPHLYRILDYMEIHLSSN